MQIDFTTEEITDLTWALRMFAYIKEPAPMVERMRILEVKLQQFIPAKKEIEEKRGGWIGI